MLRSAMGYLAAADATAMEAATQAQCLRTLEQLHAIETAARASVLGALASSRAAAGRTAPDAILIVAAKTGANLRDLAEVFGGIYTLARPRPGLVPVPEPAVIGAVAN